MSVAKPREPRPPPPPRSSSDEYPQMPSGPLEGRMMVLERLMRDFKRDAERREGSMLAILNDQSTTLGRIEEDVESLQRWKVEQIARADERERVAKRERDTDRWAPVTVSPRSERSDAIAIEQAQEDERLIRQLRNRKLITWGSGGLGASGILIALWELVVKRNVAAMG